MRNTTITLIIMFCTCTCMIFQGFAQSHALTEPEPGSCTLQPTEEGRFSIWAKNAPLDAVIRDLGRLHGAEVRVAVSPDDVRTFRYLDVNLIEALDRLDIDYSLNYIRDESGEAVLSGGYAGQGEGGAPVKHPWLPLPTGPEADRIRKLVNQLRDDDIRWNYEEAMTALYTLKNKRLAIPFLEQALAEGDWQQRRGAFQILRGYTEGWAGSKAYSEPSQLFLEVTVSGMTDDYIRDYKKKSDRPSRSATYGLNYFVRNSEHVPAVEPMLTQALYQQDRQYRFLSATLLGGAGRTSNAGRVVEILAPQLLDNDTSRDSTFAIYGLSGLGPMAESYLKQFETTADQQALGFIDQIRENWQNPNWETNHPYLRTTYWEQDDFMALPGDRTVRE